MNGLPVCSGKRVLRILLRAGYSLDDIEGSHHYLFKPGVTGLVVVPVHGNRDLPPGTLRSILQQAGLTIDAFNDLLTGRIPGDANPPAEEDDDLVALRAERERVRTQLRWTQLRGEVETSRYLTDTLVVLDALIEERLRELDDEAERS